MRKILFKNQRDHFSRKKKVKAKFENQQQQK